MAQPLNIKAKTLWLLSVFPRHLIRRYFWIDFCFAFPRKTHEKH